MQNWDIAELRAALESYFAELAAALESVTEESLAAATVMVHQRNRHWDEPRPAQWLPERLFAGHVDGVGELLSQEEDARSRRLRFRVPDGLARYLAAKGSVCVDGVSLTVNEVEGREFGVNVIPHTAAVTTLGGARPGSRVNLEADLVARYVERLLNGGAAAA